MRTKKPRKRRSITNKRPAKAFFVDFIAYRPKGKPEGCFPLGFWLIEAYRAVNRAVS